MKIPTIVLLMLFPSAIMAQVYKWVDEDGQVHYSSEPPSAAATQMNVDMPQPDDASRQAAQERLERQKRWLEGREEEKRVKQEQKQRREQEKQAKREHESNCAKLKLEMDDIKKGGVIWYDLDEKGERVYLSDQDLDARLAEMEQTYKANCS